MLQTAVEAAADAYRGQAIRVEGEGQLSVAVRVGGELLLRFPRHALGVDHLRLEVRLLELIRPHVDLAVPEVLEVALDRPVGRAYVAHRYLPGEVVGRAAVDQWPQERTRDVGAQVGVFLRQLHSLAAVAREVGVRRLGPRVVAEGLAHEFSELLASRTSDLGRSRAHREIAAMARLPDDPLVLCHTDLGGNIIFDEESGTVSVIDFGSCLITHPAFDVASISVLGDDFVTSCLAAHPALASARQYSGAVEGTFVLQDALYGARQQDWPYVDEVLAGYGGD